MRRTTTMDFSWPDGMAGNSVLDGRARDLRTGVDGRADVLAEATLTVVSDQRRVISEISAAAGLPAPGWPGLERLAGQSAMSGFRRRLAEVAADGQPGAGSLLYQLLDDIPGATLVSGAAWQGWYDLDRYLELKSDVRQRVMRDVCTGYQDGSSALNPDGTLRWQQSRHPAVEIDDAGDDLAWHPRARPAEVSMRRARRIDVWLDRAELRVDAFFQDSSTLPGGGRQAIHEYTLTARADLETGTLASVTPVPRVLPYRECPLAVTHVGALEGVPLAELRGEVLGRLRGPLGCTHLNDMLRALACLPELAGHLPCR